MSACWLYLLSQVFSVPIFNRFFFFFGIKKPLPTGQPRLGYINNWIFTIGWGETMINNTKIDLTTKTIRRLFEEKIKVLTARPMPREETFNLQFSGWWLRWMYEWILRIELIICCLSMKSPALNTGYRHLLIIMSSMKLWFRIAATAYLYFGR